MLVNDENNFPHKLLLTNTLVSNLRKGFANNSSANIKLSKTQLYKIGQSGGFLGRLLGPVLKTGLLWIKNVLKPLAKSVLIPLGLTVAATAIHAPIHKKLFGHVTATLIISNEKMNDIFKIVKSLEESRLSISGIGETKTKQKNKQEDFW